MNGISKTITGLKKIVRKEFSKLKSYAGFGFITGCSHVK